MKSELDTPVEMSGMLTLSGFSKWDAKRPPVVESAASLEHLITDEVLKLLSPSFFNGGKTSSTNDWNSMRMLVEGNRNTHLHRE